MLDGEDDGNDNYYDDGLDGEDDGNDNYYDEINSNDDYHEINSNDGLDGDGEQVDDGSLHSSALPSSSTTPKQSSPSTPAAAKWKKMSQTEKKQSQRRVKDLKKIQRYILKIDRQKSIIDDLHTAMKNAMENLVVPKKPREDQISYLEKLFGDSVDFNLLDDVELKTKYASAHIFRQTCPKMPISKFRRHYAIKYLE